ncbi:histidine phosphatase superfamily [Pseudomassariella vexata]|uniref:Phytase A n=1 Tax=Pseudomassariella vexata TaxID=1141098 RepID=A0A1Y2DX78_9PEZI|nr:histidine phosphatase superfamily [Pseudomassariella vexata]ORY63225.1 histidine phosphatase superfamily [Pseudomassariella vexata]
MDGLRAWAAPASYKYTALPERGSRDAVRTRRDKEQADGNRAIIKLAAAGLVIVVALYFVVGYMKSDPPQSDSCDDSGHGFHCRPDISHFWGQYSPFYSVKSDISPSTPKGCNVTFAQVLSRHGARDPTLSKTVIYGALLARVQSTVTHYGKDFTFLSEYNYSLGADQLTHFGQQEMVNSGIHFYNRYKDLTRNSSPFVRSAGQYRVVESAQNWTQGFHQARLADKHTDLPDTYPYGMVLIPEGSAFNNTLSHDLCSASSSAKGSSAQAVWLDVFAPRLTERLNANLPGANLTNSDTIAFMDLCPFNTVANADGKLSHFCKLFDSDDWHAYDYYQSLGKWYGFGNGNPLGPTKGVGYVNELIARLTGEAVVDHTNTNSTLDSSPETFPLDRALYADFSHDNDMSNIFAAMGLYNETEPLSNTTKVSPKGTKGFSASWTVPFAARMYVEKLSCGDSDEEMVRVLINDRVIPLQNCGVDELGRCELGNFVDSLSFARDGGHWDKCFE